MKAYLYLTVFFGGMVTLAIELTASRLLGSVFGTSNLVWASIIGLILIYLTVGYFVGGWWADRSPFYKTMYLILAWGAFMAGLVPLFARPVLRLAADAFDQLQVGILFGSFAAVLILFSIPVTLFGMVSPFAIRLSISDPGHSGKVSGQIYAISTLGSFVGTFLPVLLFIPLIGTTKTFLSFSLLLMGIALIGLWLSCGLKYSLYWIWMPIVILVLTLVFSGGSIKTTSGQIYETESAYNYIQVLEIDGFRMLRLNEGQGIHSMWHPTIIDYDGPWKQFLAAPYFNEPDYHPENVKSMAIIGLAAGTTARQASEVYGSVQIDGFEIDSEIIRVGREYFEMDQPNLSAIAQDGRVGLARSDRKYNVIGVDAYRPPYIPWHLTTVEFFESVRDHLTADGVVAINVGRSPDDRRLIDGLASTMRQVFPSVYVMDVPGSFNSIIYASAQPTSLDNFYNNLIYLYTRPDAHPLLVEALEMFVEYQQATPSSGTVYTDDLAPIEWITNSMVMNYVLFGDMESLK